MARIRTVYRDREIGSIPDEDGVASSDVQQPRHQSELVEADPLDAIDMPPLAKDWLRRNPKYMYDADENAKIGVVHKALLAEGYEPYTAPYFAEVEQRLEASAVDRVIDEARAAPVEEYETGNSRIRISPKRVGYSAPPSREVPSSDGRRYDDGRITLTVAQKEAAAIAGISQEEYAAQVLRLQQEKANGNYTGGQ